LTMRRAPQGVRRFSSAAPNFTLGRALPIRPP
jgi:hypothetical protein